MRRAAALARELAMLAAAAIAVAPLGWALLYSLREPGLPPPRGLELPPGALIWENYARIFTLVPLARYLLNSLIVSLAAVPLTLLAASWAGFALAQLEGGLARAVVRAALGLSLLPGFALWLARFLLYRSVGVYDTLWALIMPALIGTAPLFTLLFYWAYRRMPADLFEAARADGAGALQTWALVALPLSRPALAAAGLLAFSWHWGDYIGPLLYLRSERNFTLPLGLQLLQQLDRTDWPLLMAAALLVATPVALLFLATQRLLWRGGYLGLGEGVEADRRPAIEERG